METSTSGGRAPSSRRHRWPRRAALAVLSVVGAALVLLLGALAYLATSSGGERLRRLVVEKANAALAGTLRVEKLSLHGGHLVLRGVELRDPGGGPVASVSSLEVRVRVAPLLRKRIDLALVRIEGPEISIVEDEEGSNLQRALAERNPSPRPEEGEGEQSSLGLVVEDLDVSRGAIDVLQRSAGSSRHVHLDGFAAHGAAKRVGDAMEARLTAGGTFAAPFEGPLHLRLEAAGAGARKDLRLSLQAGGAKLAAAVSAEDDTHAHARLESLVIPPEIARAFAPAYPLRAAASVSGDARRDGDEVSVHLDAGAASASARLDADLDLVTRRTRRTAIALRHVDLSELTDGGPSSDVALALTASGGGRSLDDLAGRLELRVPPSPMAGETMGPVRVLATASGGELRVPELLARAPGLRVEARGRASRARLALTGSLVARDLAAFSRTLGKLAGPNGLAVKGRGRMELAVGGSAEHPAVRLDGRFPVLVHAKTRVDGLVLHLDAPDGKAPAGTRAHVAARTLALAPDKVFRAARLDLDGRGRQLGVDAALHGYAELSVQVRGALSSDGHRATLHALSVRYPEARWSLEAPVEIEARPGLLRIAPLTLRSGDQAISARVRRRGAVLDASLALRSFDLAKLPRAFVDPRLGLGGVLDLELHAKGRSSRPDLAAKLDLQRGRFKRYRNLQLRLEASYARDEARGSLAASGEGIALAGKFDLPVKALQQGRRVPVSAELRIPELRLDESLRDLGVEEPISGTVSAELSLRGTADDPRLRLSFRGRRLQVRQLAPADVDLSVANAAGDAIRGEVQAVQGGRSILAATASVGAGPRELGNATRLGEAPLSVDAHVGPLSLSELQEAIQPAETDPAEALPRIHGTLAGRLSASGTLRDPRVVLRTRLDGLGAERTPEGQVTLSFDYRNAKQTLDLLLRSQNGGELHAAAAARVDLSHPAVTRARVEAAPVEGSLEAKDFDPAFLSNVGGALERVGGLLYADARVGGTIGSPAVKGRVEWKNGALSTHGSGDFTEIHLLATGDDDRLELKELTAKSGGGRAKVTGLATRTGGKAFRLHASAELDKFPVTSQGQVAATVSIRSTVDGEASPARVTLKNLDIPEAHVQLPEVRRKDVQKLSDPSDVVLTVRGKPVRGGRTEPPAGAIAGPGAGGSGSAAGSHAGGSAGTQVTIFVNAPRNLWIQGKDVNTEVGLSDGFRVEYASELDVFGAVNVLRGRLDVFGRRFDFQRDSKVSFRGPVLQPSLDVTAAYKNEIEQVTVYLKVQGQAEKLQLRPTSDPPLPETEIYTLLATGHTTLHHGSGTSSPSGEAASLVGSVAASQLKKTLSSKLPLDVLSIEAGDKGIAGSKLEAGTYVNDRLYLGFTGRLGADPMRGENSNEVDAEYQLSKHWSLNGSYGDAHAGGASVNWRKDY